jgi:putative AlgH/UPF0301 family transcriptional regulator
MYAYVLTDRHMSLSRNKKRSRPAVAAASAAASASRATTAAMVAVVIVLIYSAWSGVAILGQPSSVVSSRNHPTTVSAFVVVAPTHQQRPLRHHHLPLPFAPPPRMYSDLNAKKSKKTSSSTDPDGYADEDWRAFRARLVQNGLPGSSSSSSSSLRRSKRNKHSGQKDHDGNMTTTTTTTTTSSLSTMEIARTTMTTRYAHECTPLVEVGTILLSIPTTDLCQALELQFWHRSVVLITAVCNDKVQGRDMTNAGVPKSQLAQGAGRGRWTYRGILLNRMTDLTLFPDDESNVDDDDDDDDDDDSDGDIDDDKTTENMLVEDDSKDEDNSCSNKEDDEEKDENGWRILRGGDLASLDMADGHTEFMCLHTLDLRSDTNVAKVSTRLVGNLSVMSLADAQALVRASLSSSSSASASASSLSSTPKYTPADFYTYGGFCSWRPGQLETEMGESRREWLALSVDAASILDEIRQQAASTAEIMAQQQQLIKQQQEQATKDEIQQEQDTTNNINNTFVAHGLLDAGTNMWRNFLGTINGDGDDNSWSESRATERIPAGQLEFYDMMLRVWAEENLCVDEKDDDHDDNNDDSDDAEDDNINGDDEHEDTDGDDDDDDDDDGDDDSVESVNVADGSSVDDSSDSGSGNLIGPGTLVRATSDVSNDILLFDQEFIRSVVLVLEETPEATVGVILNLPLSAAVECIEGEPPLPLRYGGPVDLQDWKDGNLDDSDDDDDDDEEEEIYQGFLDFTASVNVYSADEVDDDDEDEYITYPFSESGDEDEDSSFIWIHRDASLGSLGPDGGGGSPLGSSGLYVIKESDVVSALQAGSLSQDDTMVFSGACIWEKAEDLGTMEGGLRGQVDSLESLEIVQAHTEKGGDDSAINTVWDILSQGQEVLEEKSLEYNIAAAVEAWTACVQHNKTSSSLPSAVDSTMRPTSRLLRDELSDAALRAWIGVNLLGDPLGTFVEVKRRRELRG